MLTKSGPKLLDFGLAKSQPVAVPVARASDAPTLAEPVTGEGAILGTVQYMAPEQLDGEDLDGRADIFAFGAVLYETLTGRKAFSGSSQASLIANIMHVDPPTLGSVLPIAPPGLERMRTWRGRGPVPSSLTGRKDCFVLGA